MTNEVRVSLAARTFFLAVVLGVALAFDLPAVLQGTLLLAVVAAAAWGVEQMPHTHHRALFVVEGALAALVIGTSLPDGAALLPYLIVPTVLAGIRADAWGSVAVFAAEVTCLAAVLALGGANSTEATREGLQLASSWLFAGLGAGLIASWRGQSRMTPARVEEASYESARRLLSQLRTVARRLSSGLDLVSLATQILDDAHDLLGAAQSGLFIRTNGGVFVPLVYRGLTASESLSPDGPLVTACWDTCAPTHGRQPAGSADRRHRTVLPLRSAGRMFGVLISDSPSGVPPVVLEDLMREVDEQALRLDTALVFDEVRSLATTEERQRLAREIHDGVAQEIASLGYLVDELAASSSEPSQRKRLRQLREEISRVVNELRLSIFDLRSEISPSAGLGSALSDYVRAVGARSGFTVHLTLNEAPTRLRIETETELLRIVQEAVTNARKHSEANNLWVDCRIAPPRACITVHDDGGGLGQGSADSYGLKIMRERAGRVGASLDIGDAESPNGRIGTRVAVSVGGIDESDEVSDHSEEGP